MNQYVSIIVLISTTFIWSRFKIESVSAISEAPPGADLTVEDLTGV
mgnify:CR=1 FL=1